MSIQDELTRQFHQHAPSPSAPVDMDDIARRASRRQWASALPVVAVALLLLAGVLTLVVRTNQSNAVATAPVGIGAGSGAADPAGPLYVLTSSPSADPQAVLNGHEWATSLLPADPDLRSAGGSDGLDFYVTLDSDGALCLLVTGVEEGLTGSCATDAVFAARGHLPLEVFDGGYDPSPDFWAAVVPNGVSTATIGSAVQSVTDNLVVFTDPPSDATEVVLDGPAGSRTLPIVVDLSPDSDDRSQPYPAVEQVALVGPSAVDDSGCLDTTFSTAQIDATLRSRDQAVTWRWTGPTQPTPPRPGGAPGEGDGEISYSHERSAAPFGSGQDLSVIMPSDSPGSFSVPTVVAFAHRQAERTDFVSCAGPLVDGIDVGEPTSVAAAWVAAYNTSEIGVLLSLTAGGVRPGDTMEDFIDQFGFDPLPGSSAAVSATLLNSEAPENSEPTAAVVVTIDQRSVLVDLVEGGGTGWTVVAVTVEE